MFNLQLVIRRNEYNEGDVALSPNGIDPSKMWFVQVMRVHRAHYDLMKWQTCLGDDGRYRVISENPTYGGSPFNRMIRLNLDNFDFSSLGELQTLIDRERESALSLVGANIALSS